VAIPVILPKFEMSQESATIVEWLKGEGDRVEMGEPVLLVETDKITMEVESPAAGILAGIRGEPNQTVPVAEIVAYVLQPGEVLPGTATPAPPMAVETAMPSGARGVDLFALAGAGNEKPPTRAEVETPVAVKPLFQMSKVRATPAARRIARERAMDLDSVTGSGPQGRIQAADVAARVRIQDTAAARAEGSTVADGVEVRPMSGLRRTIAQRMALSHQTTARVTLVTEADATNLVEARTRLEDTVTEAWGFAPGYNDLLALIVSRALREFPYMNARLSSGDGGASGNGIRTIEWLPYVNLGIAVDTKRGLLVPVIRNADRKGLQAIGDELRALVGRAQAGRSLPDDLRGGTFTITNLGIFGIDAFTPVINLPEAAILGAGRIQARPVVCDGEIVIRQMWTQSLAFDHRLVDGAPAARFLQRIKQLIENPLLMLG
jgi:pyruvate dehydrogenase E2 component (dihydrolipoamide acetyltransferase)